MMGMNIKKYTKASLISICYIVVIVLILGIFSFNADAGESMALLIPGDQMSEEIVFIFLVVFVLFPLITVNAGYLISPIFLYIQAHVTGRKMNYSIQERAEEEKFRKIFRGFFPALMALNLAMMLGGISSIQTLVSASGNDPGNATSTLAMLMFTIPLALVLFSSTWFILDSGIVSTNHEKNKNSDQPVELKSSGGFFMDILKGYAGIGVIVGFYELFSTIIGESKTLGDLISAIIFLGPLPLFCAIGMIPSIILLDLTRDYRINYVRKWAEKIGMIEYSIDLKVEKKI